MDKNLSYYSIKNETLNYDIIDISIFGNVLNEIALCKVFHGALKFTRKTWIRLSTEIRISCTVCENSDKMFDNCDKICNEEINSLLCLKKQNKTKIILWIKSTTSVWSKRYR